MLLETASLIHIDFKFIAFATIWFTLYDIEYQDATFHKKINFRQYNTAISCRWSFLFDGGSGL